MSRSFDGSTQYGYNSFTMGTTPLTMAAWVYATSTTGSGKCLAAICGNSLHYQMIGLSTALGKWYCASRGGGSEAYAASTTAPASSTWVHVAATFASATSRAIFVNGVSEGTNSTSVTVSPTRTSFAARTDGAVPSATPSYFTGQLAEICFYDAALAASQIASLAAGVSPLQVAPANLRLYVPLWGESSPELNLRGATFTLVGTPPSGSSGPRVFRSQ